MENIVKMLAENVDGNVWNVRLGVLDAFEKIVEKLQGGVLTTELVTTISRSLFLALEDNKVSPSS